MSYLFSPKGFLQVGGAVLVLVAVLGYIGIIGPTADSLFGPLWYFDNAENVAHLVLGVVALGLVFTGIGGADLQKWVTIAVGAFAIFVTLWSLMGPIPEGSNLWTAQLQNPADTLLHTLVGVWGLIAGLKKGSSMY